MAARLRRLVDLRADDALARQVIRGLHVEGPFLNEDPAFAGAHPTDAIRPASIDAARQLIDAGQGLVRLFTLAPERDRDGALTRWLHEQRIVVAAGHSDATIDQLDRALDAGLALFTHLGNGCPVTLDRHDNIVQRVLWIARQRPLWVSFIADGAHIPLATLSNYLALVPPDRAIITSDAMAAAGLGPGRYTIGRHDLQIGDDLVPRAPDGPHLLGAATPLARAEQNLRKALDLSDADIHALTRHNPRRLLAPKPTNPQANESTG